MAALVHQPGCENSPLLVQDFVPNNFELRVYVVRGEQSHVVYSDFDVESCSPLVKPDRFEQKTRSCAVADWLDGDESAMLDAETQVAGLVSCWLRWLRAMSSDPVPAIRMDFLVHHLAVGEVQVHSLELTELGFSLLGWRAGPQVVMEALVASCFDDTESTVEEGAALSAFQQRRVAEA